MEHLVSRKDFEQYVINAYERLPENIKNKVKNVALIVEDEPSVEVGRERNLGENDLLFGLYQGTPVTLRGAEYGIGGMTLPDKITIYQNSIEKIAGSGKEKIQQLVFETMWHEIAHYFGMNEEEVRTRELLNK